MTAFEGAAIVWQQSLLLQTLSLLLSSKKFTLDSTGSDFIKFGELQTPPGGVCNTRI